MASKIIPRNLTWEALTESAKLGCGVIMIGNGRFALVDEEIMPELEKATWMLHTGGYTMTKLTRNKKSTQLYMHRFISNPEPGMEVDHKNHNKLDNRLCNLRNCSRAQNIANNGQRRHNKSSKFKGVRKWSKGGKRFSVRCIQNGKETSLGGFDTEVEAAIAYNEWAKKTFGEFAQLNIIP